MNDLIANIGGTFIFSEKPETLAAWYEKVLGIKTTHYVEHNCWCTEFPYLDQTTHKNYTVVWSIIKTDKRPQVKGEFFTLNYRVNNMQDMLAHFKKNQISFEPVETHPEGLFTWIIDPDGNRIELWEACSIEGADQ